MCRMPTSRSWLEKGKELVGLTSVVDPCAQLETRLPELPNIMQHLEWTNGEALMRDWFSRPKNSDPKAGTPNIDTITMDWVLGYERAEKVYNQAVADKVWVNAAARKSIEKMLTQNNSNLPANVGDQLTFGDVDEGRSFTPDGMKKFDADYYFQQRSVNSSLSSDPLDDLFAALANFNFQFVTQGTVERLPDVNGKAHYKVTLDKVGIYVKDSYDFNDHLSAWNDPKTWASQPLGYWDCADQDVTKTPRPGAYYVNNQDFREWRDKYGNGKGGDFLVFSDIKVISVSDSFEF